MKSPRKSPRIAVIGAGAIGSTTALALAGEGADVTIYDRFAPPHGYGAHAGESRLLRTVPYLEKTPGEAALLVQGLEGWERIEKEAGRPLITRCGGLIIDDSSSERLAALDLSSAAGVESLTRNAVGERFPQFEVGPEQSAVFDARAGIIDPAAAVEAALELAASRGARCRFNERVHDLRPVDGGVEVRSASGTETYDRVVLAAGAFSAGLEPGLPMYARRLLLGWFTPRPGMEHLLEGCPSFVWTPEPGQFVYGGRSYDGRTLKVGIDWDWGAVTDPASQGREVAESDREAMQESVRALLPWLDPVGDRFEMHIDGWSEDKIGFLGERPDRPNIILATAWSGYGFKLAPALGETAARLALGKEPGIDIEPLSPNRRPVSAPAP
ncbi:N-methyl-L-tryptophan oxidase [Arthrobacter ginkgonis]|uniref:N-methyl-L-tryptophan oxidase n=1 Tax=Arthrobacter ginkgonis TaxID=1630594 RepID=A0ABP7CYG5_9MICC